jgi:hypothetical protein
METVHRSKGSPTDCLMKVILRRGGLPYIYEAIRRQGITDSVVFPELDGLARPHYINFSFVSVPL